MDKIKIGFIGAGNMAASIIGGLAKTEDYAIYVHDPDAEKLSSLVQEYAVTACESNVQLIQQVEVVVLAVKPQVIAPVIESFRADFAVQQPMIISIAAGITCQRILSLLGDEKAVCVRVMPNTPALVGSGASGLYAQNASDWQKSIAEKVMSAVGLTVWLDSEDLIDVVTAVSGSGPAYFFLLMESIYNSAIEQGMDSETAKQLTLQTALGSAQLAIEQAIDFGQLRSNVTSPGGTTEAAINVFNRRDFSQIVDQAVDAAVMRSKELAKG